MSVVNEISGASGGAGVPPAGGHDRADFDAILEPRAVMPAVDLGELRRHKDLLFYWTLRNLKARHAQSVLGIAWAVIQPVVNTVIFAVVFGGLVGVPSDGVPYPLFAMVGMAVWTFFSGALRDGVESLTRHTNLLGKIFFPRLVLPLSAVAGKLIDLAISGLLVIALMIWYGAVPRLSAWVAIPALVLVLFLACLGLSLWLSALAVQYRDVGHAVMFAIQALMYVSPIVYSDRVVPGRFRVLYGLNPVAGVVAGARAVLLGTGGLPWDLILPGSATAAVLALTGLMYFRGRERLFADVA